MKKTPQQINPMEKWMGYVAVFVATLAAVAALYEARINREHQSISVWPYLQMWVSINNSQNLSEGQFAVSFNIANKGVGPAIIESVELRYNNKAFPSWPSFVLALAKENNLNINEIQAGLSEASIEPGEVVEASEVRWIIGSQNSDLAQVMANAFYNDKSIHFETFYCSLYKDCWKVSLAFPRPNKVTSCRLEG